MCPITAKNLLYHIIFRANFAPDMAGLYIHIPFCGRKCLYCDFYSVMPRGYDMEGYSDSLLRELRARRDELGGSVDTLYLGGGTPSLLTPYIYERLMRGVRDVCGEAFHPTEITLEANPEDVTAEMVDVWRRGGVNRLSLGVQTLVDSELRAINRRHDAARAREAMRLAGAMGNMSVDVIFGLPGQTLASFRHTLDGVLEHRPQHLSAYCLMYEPGTGLTRLRDMGRIKPTDDGLIERMYVLLTDTLEREGYEHYEISNYALPGYRSRHNTSYWHGVPYVGLGPGAHSYDGHRTRCANPCDVASYIKGVGEPFVEHLTDTELEEEYILTRMRMAEGIDFADFRARFGSPAADRVERAAKRLASQGLISLDGVKSADGTEAFVKSADRAEALRSGGRIALTRSGVMLSDTVIVSLFG